MSAATDLQPGSAPPSDLRKLDRWWRAANYLAVGQIHLMDNPLLRTPLRPEHVKPRLLGHWGTTPGLTFVWAHLYAHVPPDAEGTKELFRQFSFPGGIPSHAAPETPGSIDEGGELGYSLVDVIDRVPGLGVQQTALRQHMLDERLRCRRHTREFGEDAPDVADWVWPA